MNRLQEILDYWFGENPDDLQVIRERRDLWFGKDEQIDAEIRERFGDLLGLYSQGRPVPGTLADRLALILLFDQFSRNIHRNRPQAFEYDHISLQLTLEGLQTGLDRQLRYVERVFFYLPLEHSEDLLLQNRSVELFTALHAEVPQTWQTAFAGFLEYAIKHQEIIERFGRFPHRNAILGRPSTAEERAFLQQPGSSF